MNIVEKSYSYGQQNLYRSSGQKSVKQCVQFLKQNVNSDRKSSGIKGTVSGSRNLSEINQVNERKNTNVAGSMELSDADIKYFREKYDVENMSYEEYMELLKELSDRDVISNEDVKKQFAHQMSPGGSMLIAWDGFSEPEPEDNNFLEKLLWEMKEFEYCFSMIKNGKYSMKEAALYQDKLLRYYDEQKNANEKLLKVMKQIKRSSF